MAEKETVCFDSKVLECLRYQNNHMAESLLNKYLCKVVDHWGTLLHYAANHGSIWVTQHLIELGSEIDSLSNDGKTPLMIALEKDRHWIVPTLLEANASIHIQGPDGRSPAQMLFQLRSLSYQMLECFFPKIQSETSNTEEFIERLLDLGCTAYHAAYCKDFERIFKGLLECGIDVNSTGYNNRTALHAASYLDDLEMVKMLIDKGIFVDALDDYQGNALIFAALNGNEVILQLLLEKGANVNARHSSSGYTSLYRVYAFSKEEFKEKYDKCAELLLLYGAVPKNSTRRKILDKVHVRRHRDSYRANLLIAHIAMLEMLGTSIIQSLTGATIAEYHRKYPEFGKYHDLCQEVLKIRVFKSLTLLDLLTENESKMRIHVRSESFVTKQVQFSSESNLSEQYPLYSKKLEEGISKAIRTVELEDTVIPIICKILKENCYVAAREIVCYLNLYDLEQFCEAFN